MYKQIFFISMVSMSAVGILASQTPDSPLTPNSREVYFILDVLGKIPVLKDTILEEEEGVERCLDRDFFQEELCAKKEKEKRKFIKDAQWVLENFLKRKQKEQNEDQSSKRAKI